MSDRPRVLLLGDSIRISYQPLVAEMMKDRADVVGPDDNGRFALYTSMRLPAWLEECGPPDVVHWNNGIWDSGTKPDREPVQFSITDYLTNLRTILDMLRDQRSEVIWATITPIHPSKTDHDSGWTWTVADIDMYNTAALELMIEERVPVNDLHGLVSASLEENLAEDLLHLSELGQQRCATAVVSAVDRVLAEVKA